MYIEFLKRGGVGISLIDLRVYAWGMGDNSIFSVFSNI
jgi:hypothetical protein